MTHGLNLGEGVPFDNGPTCKGVAYPIVDSENDFSTIEITGRYPEKMDTYACNNGSREEVTVEAGGGWLYRMSAAGFLSFERLEPGSRVDIEPGENFAWLSKPPSQDESPLVAAPEGLSLEEMIAQLNGETRRQAAGMKLAMLCVPAFNPDTYVIRTEDEILESRTKEGEK